MRCTMPFSCCTAVEVRNWHIKIFAALHKIPSRSGDSGHADGPAGARVRGFMARSGRLRRLEFCSPHELRDAPKARPPPIYGDGAAVPHIAARPRPRVWAIGKAHRSCGLRICSKSQTR
jgi:hypothetical protein